MKSVVFSAVPDLPEILAGQALTQIIATAVEGAGVVPAPFDVIVVAQKIVSKAEGRVVDLRTITPSPRALELATQTRKDARLVEVVLSESQEVMRTVPNVLIVRHRLGFVMANAGIDRSNVPGADRDQVLLLPKDPDASAERLRSELSALWQVPVAVLISDSFGRAWRNGVVNVAIGAAGLPSIIDRRGEYDREGRALEMTEVALADAIAAGAALVMGEASEGTPVVIARGLQWTANECRAAALLRSRDQDLFR
ncbi:MAG TPA: coenzyme F420-0:L-glutamate ligase [Steroidobacter sp.]|nr:coenzyme F420-0:L-glutamate ligase [Steroidobacter sp.]